MVMPHVAEHVRKPPLHGKSTPCLEHWAAWDCILPAIQIHACLPRDAASNVQLRPERACTDSQKLRTHIALYRAWRMPTSRKPHVAAVYLSTGPRTFNCKEARGKQQPGPDNCSQLDRRRSRQKMALSVCVCVRVQTLLHLLLFLITCIGC